MTAVGWWLALAVVVCVTATVRAMWRDYRRAAKAEARAERAERRARVAEARAETCAQHAREWAAIADERAADLIEHQHRCLGELVHNDSGVRNS